MQHNFEESVLDDIKNMDQRLTELEEKIDSIDTKLTQVVDAILGNPLTKTGGFINDIGILKEKIEELEKKVAKHEDFKKKIYWLGSAFFGIILLIQYVVNIYSSVKK